MGLVGLAFMPVGCDEPGSPEADLQVRVSALAPCPEPENGNQQIPSNSDRVVVRLTEGPISASAPFLVTIDIQDPDPTGKVAIEGVPEGSGMRLDAVACLGAEATWGGSTFGVSVQAGAETPVDLFMTPVDAVSCVGWKKQIQESGESASMPEGHAFAAVAPTPEGAIVLGGFADYDPSQDSRKLVATATVTTYDAARSTFSPAGSLQSARAMAGAVVLESGSILVVGGTAQMSLKAVKKPPLSVLADHAPQHGVEVFDPSGPDNTSDVLNCFRFPNLPSVGVIDKTRLLVVGGVGTMTNDPAKPPEECVAVKDEGWSSGAWFVAHPAVTGVSRQAGTVARPRYGATVIGGGLQSPQRALIWGGNIDGDAGIADWFEPPDQECADQDGSAPDESTCPAGTVCNESGLCVGDPSDPGRPKPEILNLVGTSSHGSSLFASGVFINETTGGSYQFLILGGTDVSDGADGPEFSVAADTSRAELVTVDPAALTFASEPVNVADLLHDVRRAAARLVPLGLVGQDLWLMGGFTSFTAEEGACPGKDVCLQEDMPRFKMLVDGNGTYALERLSSLELTVGSFGAEPTLLRDGSWLLVGGMENVTSSQDAISTDGALVRYGIDQADLCGFPTVP